MSPSMPTYTVVQLSYISLYFIYCKVASSTQALSHVEGLKCHVIVPGPPKTGKEAWQRQYGSIYYGSIS